MHRVPWTGRDVTKTQLANEPTSMNIIEGEVMNLPERRKERERERKRETGSKESKAEKERGQYISALVNLYVYFLT